MVSACRAIGQRLSKGGHSRRHLGGAHSYTLPLTTCWQRRHEMQLLLGAYNSWGEAATPFKQTKRTHNRQVIQMSVWWAPGKSVLNYREGSFDTLSQKQGPSFLLLHVAAENVGDTSGSNLGAKLVELVMGVTFPVCERFGSIDHGGSYTWLRGMLGQDCGTQKPQKGERCLAGVPQAQGMTNHDQPPTALQHELLKPSRRSGRSQRYPWSRHEQTVTHRVAPARR